jgi:hypothetical protein
LTASAPSNRLAKAAGRREVLFVLAEVEASLHQVLAAGQPRYRNDKVLLDLATGKPLRNRNFSRPIGRRMATVTRLHSVSDSDG